MPPLRFPATLLSVSVADWGCTKPLQLGSEPGSHRTVAGTPRPRPPRGRAGAARQARGRGAGQDLRLDLAVTRWGAARRGPRMASCTGFLSPWAWVGALGSGHRGWTPQRFASRGV